MRLAEQTFLSTRKQRKRRPWALDGCTRERSAQGKIPMLRDAAERSSDSAPADSYKQNAGSGGKISQLKKRALWEFENVSQSRRASEPPGHPHTRVPTPCSSWPSEYRTAGHLSLSGPWPTPLAQIILKHISDTT